MALLTPNLYTMWDFLMANWAEIVLALITLLGTITALTESTTDDKWLDVVRKVITAVVMGKPK